MRDTSEIMRDRQRAIRREIDRRGIALKAIGFDAALSDSTLLSYFPGGDAQPAVIPMSAVFKLLSSNAIPLDLMSMLLPAGMALVHVPEGVNHDDLESHCRDYLAAKGAAHHPASPAGREIAPSENDNLTRKAVHLRAVAA